MKSKGSQKAGQHPHNYVHFNFTGSLTRALQSTCSILPFLVCCTSARLHFDKADGHITLSNIGELPYSTLLDHTNCIGACARLRAYPSSSQRHIASGLIPIMECYKLCFRSAWRLWMSYVISANYYFVGFYRKLKHMFLIMHCVFDSFHDASQ